MIRVLIADDQGMVRAGFRWLLEAETDIDVVGEAVDGADAVEAARGLQPDVVLMDIRMPLLDGISATARIVAGTDTTRVLILTTFDLDEYVFDALRAGASGFLLKDASAEDLAAAIRVVARGDSLLAPAVTRRVVDAFVHRQGRLRRDPRIEQLTRREQEIFALVAGGLGNREISERLFISEATTKTHVSNLLGKLGLRDRVQAVIHAYECGIVQPGRTPP
jgi:DNA-binding NarL/FixJ family response regulator